MRPARIRKSADTPRTLAVILHVTYLLHIQDLSVLSCLSSLRFCDSERGVQSRLRSGPANWQGRRACRRAHTFLTSRDEEDLIPSETQE